MYEYAAVCTANVDGDTIHADVDLGFGVWLRGISLRFAGINAPELRTDAGKAAAARVASMLPPSLPIVIRTTRRPDDKYGGRYDAWLRPDTATAAWVNRWLVDNGYAVPLPPLPVDPPTQQP